MRPISSLIDPATTSTGNRQVQVEPYRHQGRRTIHIQLSRPRSSSALQILETQRWPNAERARYNAGQTSSSGTRTTSTKFAIRTLTKKCKAEKNTLRAAEIQGKMLHDRYTTSTTRKSKVCVRISGDTPVESHEDEASVKREQQHAKHL